MSDVQREFSKFRERSLASEEKTAFAVISGDFNVDNISPSKTFFEFAVLYVCHSYSDMDIKVINRHMIIQFSILTMTFHALRQVGTFEILSGHWSEFIYNHKCDFV